MNYRGFEEERDIFGEYGRGASGLRKRLNLPETVRLFTVDASGIALKTIGGM